MKTFLNSALAEGEWLASRSRCFTPEERAHSTHWMGGWMDLRADLDSVEKRKILTLPGIEHCHYTDGTIPALIKTHVINNILILSGPQFSHS
jgi:hypothetical protein